jgi:hypothetical protein
MVTSVTPLKTLPLRPPKAPNLPVAPTEITQQYLENLTNVLRLYFNQIDNFAAPLSTGAGGTYINFPYAAISSSVTQTATTNTATLLTFNTIDFANGFTVASNTNITPTYAGLYNLQFSVQLQNLANSTEDVFIWLRQYTAATATLADITGSTGLVGMVPRKSAGNPSHDIKGWNYFVSLASGDYLQIVWSTTNGTDVTIPFYAASGTPTKPSTQSVVATMQFVSALY